MIRFTRNNSMFNKKLYMALILGVFPLVLLPSLQKYAQNRLLSNIYKNKSNLFSFNFPKLFYNRLFLLFRRQTQLFKNKKLIVNFDPNKDRMSQLYPGESYLEKRAAICKVIYENNKIASRIIYYETKPGYFYISYLDTDQKYQKKGYARALLEYAIGDSKKHGAKYIKLLVKRKNYDAIALYESEGFVPKKYKKKHKPSFITYYYKVPKK
jgi:ribosomal protein S18 acetylase RimI-like enzyme